MAITQTTVYLPNILFDETEGSIDTSSQPGIGVSIELERSSLRPTSQLSNSNILHPVEGLTAATTNDHHMLTRSKRGIVKKKAFLSVLSSICSDSTLSEPYSHKTALKVPAWKSAMQEEYDALINQNTWTLVPLPPDKNLVSCKWIFKIKKNADGSIARHKARLVARGFSQEYGIDYDETYSPVVRHTTVRMILSIAASYGWPLHQLDVKNAFLHGVLNEEVYMTQPPGFEDSQHPTHVCKLQKSLYGLKQAPRAWNERFASFLPSLGFKSSYADPSLFTLISGTSKAYLLLYVDDIILTGNCDKLLAEIKTSLQHEFEMKDLGPLHYFLGLEIKYLSHGLFVSQQKYARDLIHKAGLDDCHSHITPCQSGLKLLKDHGTPLSSNDAAQFRSLVGCLQYLTFTRPDIAFSVNSVCQFLHCPTDQHFTAAKRILKYVKGTNDYGITFRRGSFSSSDGSLSLQVFSDHNFSLQAYSDADWAGDPNDRKSTTGFVILLNGSPVSWCSKKQTAVSRSSTEAEYRSMADTTSELQWLKHLLTDLHLTLDSTPTLHCDNISALALATNPVHHSKLKHIEVDIHFTRDKVRDGSIRLQFVCSQEQLADLFTKGLCSPQHDYLCSSLMLGSPPSS
ncbi:putative RNA-directed DNA polymerase [Rosa chinensis]|uniref:Putative RNA-directed DNA polymerase n=1 Tax=Rosa chinensis TaxID=74649 RepID=A0A2P6S6E1_ROSCH|nr:putative RNA-directed DNA polymerase [Rosa chinensis]